MLRLVEAGYLSSGLPKADCCKIKQRTLIYYLRLYLNGTFNVVSRYEWLPKLLDPRRNQYKPVFLLGLVGSFLAYSYYMNGFLKCQASFILYIFTLLR